MIKIVLIFSFFLMKAFEAVVSYLDDSYVKAALPDNVKDVYDETEYSRFRSYKKDKSRVYVVESILDALFMGILLIFNLHAWIFGLFEKLNPYVAYICVIAILDMITSIIELPFSYYRVFRIEEKYGMNKSTKKTFYLDQLKGLVISVIMEAVMILVIMFLFERFGNAAVIWTFILLVAFMLVISLIIVPLMRIFNKFTPLEDGELKDRLMELCDKYGVTVKKIVVKDASRRTTKSNAFCTGLGNKKTISLDDNLVNNFEPEEIVAVFAHEFAHAKYRHMAKSLPFSICGMGLTIIAFGVVVNFKDIFTAFGFENINYLFAEMVIPLILWPIDTAFNIWGNYLSRKHEYEADSFAAREGYGAALVASLKKLSKESLSNINPHPATVVLEYSHPTLSQRIAAIDGINDNNSI